MSKYSQLKITKIAPKVETQPVINTTVWSRDNELTAALAAFEASTPELHEEGIEVTNLPEGLNLLNDVTAAHRLVTRREQRAVIRRAFNRSREMLDTDSVSVKQGKNAKSVLLAIRGSPGIGKSWSALLYLKHLLKDKKRPIIFESGPWSKRMKWLLVFGTSTGSWTGYKLTVTDLPEDWYQFSGTDVIVDPPQFPPGMTPQPSALVDCMGHIFIPVSPDNSHLGGTHKTSADRKQFVLGPWTLREIEVAWPQMVYLDRPNEQEYEEEAKLVRERYDEFGGLPRYLIDAGKARERRDDMTPVNAKIHEKLLLSALTTAQINDNKKVVTLFFTLYPGVNENGDYDPSIEYSTVEFVSRGALKAAGQVVFDQINSDVTWRNATDASSVGLAFEAVCLMFLHMGTQGMKDMGINVHCRELAKGDEPRQASLYLGFCPYTTTQGSSELTPIIEAGDETEFFDHVKNSGDTLEIKHVNGCVQLSSQSAVSFPPPGLANVDGMSGPRLGFQMTLQENHPPSGAKYIQQRQVLNVMEDSESVIAFTVPHSRFRDGWTKWQNFRWKEQGTSDDADPPQSKRRRGASGTVNVASSPVEVVSPANRAKARASLRQFVLAFTVDGRHPHLISAPRNVTHGQRNNRVSGEDEDDSEAATATEEATTNNQVEDGGGSKVGAVRDLQKQQQHQIQDYKKKSDD